MHPRAGPFGAAKESDSRIHMPRWHIQHETNRRRPRLSPLIIISNESARHAGASAEPVWRVENTDIGQSLSPVSQLVLPAYVHFICMWREGTGLQIERRDVRRRSG